jgi:hypothetical protein
MRTFSFPVPPRRSVAVPLPMTLAPLVFRAPLDEAAIE